MGSFSTMHARLFMATGACYDGGLRIHIISTPAAKARYKVSYASGDHTIQEFCLTECGEQILWNCFPKQKMIDWFITAIHGETTDISSPLGN
jgi:hypothetical protein